MKSLGTILKWSQVPVGGVALMLIAGCGGGGGGSGSTAARSPDPVVIDSLQVGTPVCSTSGNGILDGPITPGTAATVTLTPSCTDPSATMRVALGIHSADTNITHYDWEIVGWKSQTPHGALERFDEVIDIDPANGRYIVRTYGVNTIRYASAASSVLATLTEPFTQEITVTAWTADGRYSSGFFTVQVQPAGAAVSLVYGSLTAADAPSHGRAGHYGDFYRITGGGVTTLKVEGFDTYLYVYDTALNRVGEKDEGANNGGSELTLNLQNGRDYYVEVTSFAPGVTGPYHLSSTRGGLLATPNPWSGVNVPNIAGTYTVSENTTITIVYDGVTTTTNAVGTQAAAVTQSGPSFRFQASDPTGMLPEITRYGTISGNTVSLSGEAFMPANPAITVNSNTQTSSGTLGNNQFTINTTSQLQGTYNGLPLTARVESTATFTR